MTVFEAATRYLLLLSGELQLEGQPEVNRFVRWLGGNRTLESLSSHEVAGYAESLGTTTADLAKKLEPVKAFLAWAKKEGYTSINLGTSLRPVKASGRSLKPRRGGPQETAYLTEDGYQQLRTELEALKAERPRIAEALGLAMADKDFRENAPLDAAKDQQAHVEARIRELENILKRAQLMSGEATEAARIQLGSVVVLWDIAAEEELRFMLVHPNEVSVSQGKVSIASPIGKAILDCTAGEEVEVSAPAGVRRYRIQGIETGT